jgi:spermidine synthase
MSGMIGEFEEIDYRSTPMGELVLRRRRDPRLDNREVYEIKLGDEFLMSSLFTDGEVALANLGLAELQGHDLDVVVGGLGLGYTANAVLEHESVRSLVVVELMEGVIDWHHRGLVPIGRTLMDDPRCHLVQGDFFAMVMDPDTGFDGRSPGRRFDAVLVDIDHSPRHWLDPGSRTFYETIGLRSAARHLKPGGVFALWSNDPPDADFEAALDGEFPVRHSHVISFENPYTGGESSSTVYVAKGGVGG